MIKHGKNNVYLNGILEEQIHMEVPKNFKEYLDFLINLERNSEIGMKAKTMLQDFQNGKRVCLLKKTLYGLKQAGRSWYLKLDKVLRKLGATPTTIRINLYERIKGKSKVRGCRLGRMCRG